MRGNDLPGFAAPRENLIIEKVELCSSMEDRGGNCFGNTVSIYRTVLSRERKRMRMDEFSIWICEDLSKSIVIFKLSFRRFRSFIM